MAKETTQVTMSAETLEFCQDALARQIEATYDEPGICDRGVAFELRFLRAAAVDLGVDFDAIVAKDVPASARQRLETALRDEENRSVEGSC